MEKSGKLSSLFTAAVIFALGTPVICQDKDNSDLIQKLGDIRSWDPDTKCYIIHWEDNNLEPCAIHHSKIVVVKCVSSDGFELFSPDASW